MWAIGGVSTFLHLASQIWLLFKMPAELWALPVEPLGISLGVRSVLVLPLGCLPLVVAWIIIRCATIVVTEVGLTLHQVWKFRWEEVTSARSRILFGSSYLRVSRGRRRVDLSIPLDYLSSRPLAVALNELAPPGNPIRAAFGQAS